ncbi:related to UV-damaged DNA-binding protein [Phialocephala subalpina]|uniref:DNA damage-binding protein 1 n=1 Tax=Phialocephala subalpina TaxID=576137 RepID=A0A1L7XEC1_9HELO|nr:related to UV-damaged DNA-binding protein [Phialocephala subalpina]
MAYLAPIHRPSSVRHALRLNLLDPEVECLVIAKGPRIEVWQSSEDKFVITESHHIYGTISMLAKIRPIGASTDLLFVGTQQFQYFTIGFDPETKRLETKQRFEDVADKYMRDTQSRDLCLVDPTGKYLVLELFEGVLNLIRILKPRKGRAGDLEAPHQVRITETKVRSMVFLHTETKSPKLAFLISDPKSGDVRLVTYRIIDDKSTYSTFDPTRHRENDIGDLDIGASHLIPVSKGEASDKRYIVRGSMTAKAHLGGVIVVGETKFTYLDDESKATVEHALDEASVFVAWEQLNNLTYVLGDEFGVLHLLTIQVDGQEVHGMKLQKIGKAAKATVIVHLGDGFIFIGSHEGDSQFVKLDIEAAQSASPTEDDEEALGHLELKQTMANIAPVLDFAVMDMGGREGETLSNEYSTGQARIVTGSGVYETGSFRSVRSGVGLDDVGIMTDDMVDIRGVFSLRSSLNSQYDDTLVASTPVETRIFRFDNEDIEEVVDFRGMSIDEETLLAMNLPNGYLLQITSKSVRVLGQGPQYVAAEWPAPPDQIITTASANGSHVLLSSNGVTLICLDIQAGLQEVAVQNLQEGDQVACIQVPSEFPDVGIVGFWNSGTISVLNLVNLDIIFSQDIRRKNDASIPRNIVMAQVLPRAMSGPTLFIAMEDGIVLTFNVNKQFHLSGRKSIVLGTQQARFHILPRPDGLFNVFATCEHPSLIYGSEGRIVYSAVTADDAVCVCPFDAEAYPDCIALAVGGTLKICKVDSERRTHIRTIPLGKTIRRLAYSPGERAFGIGCISRKLVKGEEVVENTFQLVEDMMFGQLGKPYYLDANNGPEVIDCVIRAELPTSDTIDEPAERFIVGTTFLSDEMAEPNQRGRILVFGVDAQKTPYLVTSLNLKCACRRLAMLGNKIVAVLYKTVVVYNYDEKSTAQLTKAATYRCATVPIDIAVTGNTIAIADMMQSLSIVEFQAGKDGLPDTLEQVARDYTPCWSTAVTDIDDDAYLESDHDGNLQVFLRNREGPTPEDRKRLRNVGELHLGEQVNVIRRIQVEPGPNAVVIPKAFMATTEGSIYLLSLISPKSITLLLDLQRNCAAHISTLGNIDFMKYRRYRNSQRESPEPVRFVDGELIERFLDVPEGVQEDICRGLGWEVEDVRGLVEGLKRLH